MTVTEFINQFSHNNECYVENKNNYRMKFFFKDGDGDKDAIMDWYLQYSDMADVKFIEIKQVYDEGRTNCFTFKIDTDKKVIYADKKKAHLAPLWFSNRVLDEHIEGCTEI